MWGKFDAVFDKREHVQMQSALSPQRLANGRVTEKYVYETRCAARPARRASAVRLRQWISLWCEVSPRRMVTSDFLIPRTWARNLVRASLAAPSTGGAVSLILRARSKIPAT